MDSEETVRNLEMELAMSQEKHRICTQEVNVPPIFLLFSVLILLFFLLCVRDAGRRGNKIIERASVWNLTVTL